MIDRLLRHFYWRYLGATIGDLEGRLLALEAELNALRGRMDLGPGMLDVFQDARITQEYLGAFDEPEPLVSVCVATYNRPEFLISRCLKSILDQTYRNIEVIIVGDACTDDTESRVLALGDPRIRFENLAVRGNYPEDTLRRWMVAGTSPLNRALELARGRFITHLDDDDAYAPERVASLLSLIQETKADLVWHPFEFETPQGNWLRKEAPAFRKGQVTTSSVFYHAWFRLVPWDPLAYQYHEPGDWNRFRKIEWLGAKLVRHPECLLRHHRERSNLA